MFKQNSAWSEESFDALHRLGVVLCLSLDRWFTRKSFTNCTLCLKQRLLISDNLRGAQVSLLVTSFQTPVLPLFSELSQCNKAKKTAESPSTSRGAQKELKQPSRACTHEAGPMMALPTQNGNTFNSLVLACHYMPLYAIGMH